MKAGVYVPQLCASASTRGALCIVLYLNLVSDKCYIVVIQHQTGVVSGTQAKT